MNFSIKRISLLRLIIKYYGKLLIVESPSKAKTLTKYLGKDFNVIASYGHIRDLSPKKGPLILKMTSK